MGKYLGHVRSIHVFHLHDYEKCWRWLHDNCLKQSVCHWCIDLITGINAPFVCISSVHLNYFFWKRRVNSPILFDQFFLIVSCLSIMCRLLSAKETRVHKKQLRQIIYCLFKTCPMKLLAWCCKCSSSNTQDLGKSEWLRRSQVLHLWNLKMMCNPPWPCRPFKVSKLLPRTQWLLLMPRSNRPLLWSNCLFHLLPQMLLVDAMIEEFYEYCSNVEFWKLIVEFLFQFDWCFTTHCLYPI